MRRAYLILLVVATVSAFAAEPERGKLTENVASRVDPSQTYTLYLPTSYDPAKKHPLLLVFDPRGRATEAAENFRGAAEELGWILISSTGTRSDEDFEPNVRALRALIPEVTRYAADPRRIYATGFSGTAMVSWLVGIQSGALAGVIGVGGRLFKELPPEKFSFASFGLAGDTDFNNRDMRKIDALLERAGKAHRFESFEGPHRWMPPELAREAVRWMELVAMKEQRRPRDESLIASAYASDIAAAAALEQGGHPLAALRRHRATLRTFEGLHPVDEARGAIARLERDPVARRELEDEEKWDRFEDQYVRDTIGRIATIIGAARSSDANDGSGIISRELRIAELLRRAKRDGAEGMTARRLLEHLHGQLTFYLLRQLIERKEYRLAAASLAVATQIHPERATTWVNLAAAHARLRDRKLALDELAKAIDLGYRDASHLATDEAFATLREDARFRELLSRIQ